MTTKITLIIITMCLSLSLQAQVTFFSRYYKDFSQENGKWVQTSHEIAPTTITIAKDGQSIFWKSIWHPLGKVYTVLSYEKTNKGLRFQIKNDDGKEFGMDFNIEENYIMVVSEKNSLPHMQQIFISEKKVDD